MKTPIGNKYKDHPVQSEVRFRGQEHTEAIELERQSVIKYIRKGRSAKAGLPYSIQVLVTQAFKVSRNTEISHGY